MPKADGTEGVDFKSTARKRKSPRFGRRRWYFLALFGGNVALVGIISALLLMRRVEEEQPSDPQPAPIDVLQTIAKGDEALLADQPKKAMDLYQLASTIGSPFPKSLSYRLGLSAEQTNELSNALAHYERAASFEATEISFAAKLGQARVHFRKGSAALSAKALAQMAAVSALPVYASTRVGREVDYLMGFVLTEQALARLPASPLDGRHVVGFELPFAADQLLSLLPVEADQNTPPQALGEPTRAGVLLYGSARDPFTTLLSASHSNELVSVVLNELAAATSWKLSLSDVANEVLAVKRVDVQLRDKTAAELLSLVLEPQRLFWTFDSNTLVVDKLDNINEETLFARNQKRAQQLIENALAVAPDHYLAPQAHLALGNLSVLAGRHERATALYREVVERFRGQPTAQAANFNLAKMLYLHDDIATATKVFYDVVDQRQGIELEPLSYLYLGRIYFDEGNLQKAKTELSRALALTNQPAISATASLTLASVYLMKQDAASAASANAVLMENREVLQHEPFRDMTIFLSCLTRFRAAITPDDVRRRGRELMAATVRVDPSRFFGDFGYLLVGNAFADLNITSETVRMYQQGLSRPLGGSMREELKYRLATEYRQQNEFELAKNVLFELSSSSSPKWASKAAMELADLLLRRRRFDECIHHCQWSLEQEYPELVNITLLRVLGRVFEELGDHEKAGICYAGFLPGGITKIAEVTK